MISKQSSWCYQIATLNLPANTKAPGTVGSILVWQAFMTICLLRFLYERFPAFEGLSFTARLTGYGWWWPLLALLIAWPITWQALKFFTQKDPGLICLDEVVGMLVSLCLIKLTFLSVSLGLILFRFFDILKPLAIKQVEKLPGAWGVLLDDVLAGIYANLTLRALLSIGSSLIMFFDF